MTNAHTRQELPYPGPQTFRATDHEYFYGRDSETATLSSFLIVEPLVLFTAQSGAGKSSLINARIKPQFAAKGFTILTTRLGGHSTAAQDYIDNIYVYSLLSNLKEYNPETREETAVSPLPPDQLAKQNLLGYFQSNLLSNQDFASSERTPRLLIIDQFEEIVTTYPAQWQHRAPFFWQLNQLLQADSRLWVLLTMREDHVAALDPYLYLLKNRLRARFYMDRLDSAAASEAIERPADKAGRPFMPEATRMLLDSLRQQTTTGTTPGQFIEPLQLQVVCYELWQELRDQPGERITPENLARSFANLDDAVKKAFTRFYDRVVQSVAKQTNVSEFDIRYWFERDLIVNMQMRGTVYQEETRTAGLPNEVVSRLNEQFLLHSEAYAGNVWYELIHDRFVAPVVEANNAWYKQADNWLFAAAREWARGGCKDANTLLTIEQLRQLPEEQEPISSGLVAKFVETSRQRVSEETLRGKREAEAKHTRRLGWYVRALSLLVVFLIAPLGVAIRQGVEAQHSKSTAVAINSTAVAEKNRAVTAFNAANAQAGAAATARTEAVMAQSTAEAASMIIISEAEAASTASALSVVARETAVAASYIAATEEAEAAIALNEATEQENLAKAARDEANAEAVLAQAALQKVKIQREQVLAQSLAINTFNVIRSNNDTELATLLALEADKINQAQTADEDINKIIQQTFLNIFAQPYFNVTLQEGHENLVEAMAFADDGQTLISAGLDGTIRLWRLDQPGLPHTTLPGNNSTTDFIRITPDGRTLVAASRSGDIQIWRLNDPNPMPVQFKEQNGDLLSLAVAPDGQEITVAVDSRNVRIRFWPLQESGEPMETDGITSRVTQQLDFVSLIYAPDGSAVYAYDPGRSISSIIRVDRNTLDFEEHYSYLPLVYSPNGEVAAYYNNIFEIVNAASTFRIATVNRPSSLFLVDEGITLSLPAAFNHNNTLFADTQGEVIRLWRLHKVRGRDTVTFLTELRGHSSPISAVVFAPDGTIASADVSGDIRLWYPNPASAIISRPASQIAFSPTREQVAWLEDGQLYMQSFDDFAAEITATTVFTGYDVHLNALAISADGSQIAAGGGLTGRGVIYIWHVEGGVEPTAVLEEHIQPVQTVAFAPDGKTLASGSGLGEYNSGDDTILVWDLENPSTPIQSFTRHTKQVNEVLFSPDGRFLVSASDDGHVLLWETSDYSLAYELTLLKNDRALSLAFSQYGLQLAVGAGSTTVRNAAQSGNIYVWPMNNLATPPLILTEHDYWVNDLAFAPNDSLLASGSEDGIVRLWQFTSGLPTSLVLVGHEQGVDSVAFAPDGRLASTDGQIVLFHITPEQLLVRGCTLVHRNLSWGEWQRYLNRPPYVPTCLELPNHPTVP